MHSSNTVHDQFVLIMVVYALSILPQIKDTAEPSFLFDFALRVHDEAGLTPDLDLRTAVSSNIMAAAVSRAPLSGPFPTDRNKRGGSDWAKSTLAHAKVYVDACLDKFSNIVPLIFKRVAEVDALPAHHITTQAIEVAVPLLQRVAEYVQDHPDLHAAIRDGLGVCLHWSVSVAVKSFGASNTYRLEKRVRSFMMSVMTVPGGSELLLRRSVYN